MTEDCGLSPETTRGKKLHFRNDYFRPTPSRVHTIVTKENMAFLSSIETKISFMVGNTENNLEKKKENILPFICCHFVFMRVSVLGLEL